MKMNKKVMGLIMSAMMIVPFAVGCNDNNVTEELPQTQIEEQQPQQDMPQVQNPVDEDLNDEYKAKIDERQQVNDLQKAKDFIEPVLNENFGYGGWMFVEENGCLGIVINAPDDDPCFNSLEDWNEMMSVMIELDYAIQYALQQQGINVQTGIMIADIDQDIPYALIMNQEVLYDIFNGINKIGL